MRSTASNLVASIRTQLWPVPLAAILAAVALGLLLPYVDGLVDQNLPTAWKSVLFDGGPDAAKSVMETIAGSLITVTALTFSLTVVTLQLASSQFSPRLLRTFSRDRVVHNTLALFLATFTFALTVLRTIRVDSDDQTGFVPRISVSVAFVLTIASVITLVGFLAHLAKHIRVETMLENVHAETAVSIDRIFPSDQPGATRFEIQDAKASGVRACSLVESPDSGFLLSVDTNAVLKSALDARAVVVIDAIPGDSLVAGVPFARMFPLDGTPMSSETLDRARGALGAAVTIGFERTSTQDAGYGLQQLLDVASKALSPGINDPTTAVHAIGHISSVLVSMVPRQTGAKTLLDDSGRVRVVMAFPTFDDLLDQAMRQFLTYAIADPRTTQRVVRLLREVAWSDRDRVYSAEIRGHLDLLRSSIADSGFAEPEIRSLETRCDDVESAVNGLWATAEVPRSRP